MALHVWNGSAWVTVNRNGIGNPSDAGLAVWNGSSYVNSITAKIWNGSSWIPFIDNVTITGDTVSTFGSPPPIAYWSINDSGSIIYSDSSGFPYIAYSWILNSENRSQYEIRAELLSGSSPSGDSLNTWLSLSTSRSWNLSSSIDDFSDLKMTIRHNITQTILCEANISLNTISGA